MQYHQEQLALGSIAQISLVAHHNRVIETKDILSDLWRQIFTFERQFSRFLPQSELSIFNRNAGSKQLISSEFRKLLTSTKKIALSVDGLYNPFILPALQAAGYGASLVKGHQHDAYDDYSNRHVVNVDQLVIGYNWAKIPEDTAIDLGGCGKGYLADQLAEIVESKVKGYWISLGGDVVFGGLSDSLQPWRIAIQRAKSETDSKDIGWVSLTSQKRCAVATSGTTGRFGTKQGKLWHHIINPYTLQPSEADVLTATLCSKSAFKADVLASCAVILGSKSAIKFLKHQQISSALLQCRSNSKGDYNVHYGNAIHLDEQT